MVIAGRGKLKGESLLTSLYRFVSDYRIKLTSNEQGRRPLTVLV